MRYSYKTNGTCSRQIDFEVENGIVTEDLAGKDQKSYGTTEVGDYICSQICL